MSRVVVALIASSALVTGCGSATSDGLFGSRGFEQNQGQAGAISYGGFPGSGGAGNQGGSADTGGFGNDTGNGGDGAVSSGGVPSDSGSKCSFVGIWGTYIVQPVSWPDAEPVLVGGTGNLQQWTLSHQTEVNGTVQSETFPCKIFLPDLQGSLLAGYAKYGIRFPDSLFDAGGIPATRFTMQGTRTASGFSFHTDPFAIVVGTTLSDPTHTPWPADPTGIVAEDQDKDGKPGVTVIPVNGNGYSYVPTDLLKGTSADLIYIAERSVSSVSGASTSCNEVHGTVTITSIGGASGIDSSVIGCRNTPSGVDCIATESNFVNAVRPKFSAAGPGTLVSVHLPDDATCADVRNRFPEQ